MDDNLSLQIDEIEALTSIYEDKIEVISEASRIYLFKVSSNASNEFSLQVKLPSNYPSDAPPDYELHAPWLKSAEKQYVYEKLRQIYADSNGGSILYEWIEFSKDYVDSKNAMLQEESANEKVSEKVITLSQNCIPTVIHGEPFTDRKSTFQAHLAEVSCIADVKAVRESLLQNRKVANATHNITAYRIINNGSTLQDCDDDGENAAGGRLLHLLQILDVINVVVIVTRWYGGILLGPDRFKHINNAARTLLVRQGYVKQKT